MGAMSQAFERHVASARALVKCEETRCPGRPVELTAELLDRNEAILASPDPLLDPQLDPLVHQSNHLPHQSSVQCDLVSLTR